MKKILIIDENITSRQDGTGLQFIDNLPNELKSYATLFTTITDALNFEDRNSIKLNFNPQEYFWVFFHDSYKDKTLDEGQLVSFKQQVPRLIIFSGGKERIGFHLKATTRDLLFNRLRSALEVYAETNLFPVKYLCNVDTQKYYILIENLEKLLDVNDIQGFIRSNELKTLLLKLNYSESDIDTQILPKYSTLSANDLYEKLNNWKSKKI